MSVETQVALSWQRSDIEQRLGFRGGKYTRVNNYLSFLVGLLLTVVFYGALVPLRELYLAKMFTERGPVPYFITLFFFWALAILFLKTRKLRLQRSALKFHVVPEEHDFVLSSTTANQVIDRIHRTVDDPKHFLLFNWIVFALSNLRNIGRVSDVENIFRAQAAQEESSLETSYALVKAFVWSVPVLGFVGTVLGLSSAIGGFGSVLGNVEDLNEITTSLRSVVSGLATAFETTLEALVAALLIHLYLTFVKKSEEEFLDACSDYCLRRVVGKLRIMPFEVEQN